MDKPVAGVVLFLGLDDFFQIHLHFIRLGVVSQADAPRNTDAVGICHHGGLAKQVAQHQVRRFAPYAGQLQQLIHFVGHFAAVLLHQHIGALFDIRGLDPV